MSAVATALTLALLASSASADQTNLRSNVVTKHSFLKDSKKFVSIYKKLKDHNKKLAESKKVRFEALATPTEWAEVHQYCDDTHSNGQYVLTLPMNTCYKYTEDGQSYSFKYTYATAGETTTVSLLAYATDNCSGASQNMESYSATQTCELNETLEVSLWAVIVNKLALPNDAGFYSNYYTSSSCSSITSYDFYLQNVIYNN